MSETLPPGTINLATLGGGVALERFEEELQRVLQNILDPNTEPQTKRTVTLAVAFVPNHDRSQVTIGVSAAAKLAPVVSYATRAYVGQENGRALAFEDNPRQVTIQQFIEGNKQNVTPLASAQGAAK